MTRGRLSAAAGTVFRSGASALGGVVRPLFAALFALAASHAVPALAQDESEPGDETTVAPAETVDPGPPDTEEVPEVIPPAIITTEPAAGWKYKAMLRPGFWTAWSDTRFRKSPGAAVVSLEESQRSNDVLPLFPLEVFLRAENHEFRFRFLWWSYESSGVLTGDFGIVPPGPVTGELDTDVLGFDFLYRIVDHSSFDLYLTMGADAFITRMDLSNGPVRDSIEETVPIVTVGAGFRVNIRDDISIYASSSALSYAQLIGMDETFFDVNDTYRNVEISLLFEPSEKLNWGVGWKHYEVAFRNSDLFVAQDLKGPCVWARLRF
ncbi:MAG: hypothetical protein ACYSU0_19665 [Planctomycetota bacterium]|jgi:hypothetical protein